MGETRRADHLGCLSSVCPTYSVPPPNLKGQSPASPAPSLVSRAAVYIGGSLVWHTIRMGGVGFARPSPGHTRTLQRLRFTTRGEWQWGYCEGQEPRRYEQGIIVSEKKRKVGDDTGSWSHEPESSPFQMIPVLSHYPASPPRPHNALASLINAALAYSALSFSSLC